MAVYPQRIRLVGRYARIIDAAKMLPTRVSFTLDGEVVVCDRKGRSDFEALHSGKQNHQAVLFAFDLLELHGTDLRPQPLLERKARLADLLAYVRDGIHLSEHLEGDGRLIFEHACRMGLEGIVSKRIDLKYRSGPFKGWLKVKNPNSAAAHRVFDNRY
jgi:bifunctional non-homologous end joining protein LigD